MIDTSLAIDICRGLVRRHGLERAHFIVDEVLDEHSITELAAHERDWENVWARAKQLPPNTDWASWGFLCGRGFGKTVAVSQFVNAEVEAGRAMLIGLAAQDEDNCVKLQVEGPSGLIATAPPWFKPEWHVSDLMLVWPNGARAYVRTPEVPGKIRGLEYHLSWLCELQSWPVATRDEAYSNFMLSTRLGYARIVWDSTAKKRHPLLKKLLANCERAPEMHFAVRGSTHENADNLGDGFIERLEQEMGGTARGREELLGEMLEETEGALVRGEWIERNRRKPSYCPRLVIGIDPAVTSRAGSDMTGIVIAGLAPDGKALVLADHSGKHSPSEWATIVLDEYAARKCELVIVETNKGGSLLVQNLRASAKDRHLDVVVLGKDERAPGYHPRTVHVREVYGRGAKEDRAQPLATAYERNRVCHVGSGLAELEETLTTWEPTPGGKSPDRLDALVYCVIELLELGATAGPDLRVGFKGIESVAAKIARPARAGNLSTLIGGGDRGGRI